MKFGVAAVVRIAEGTLPGVSLDHVEEHRRAADEAGARSGCGAALDVDQHRVLIGRRQLDERPAARGPAVAIERVKPRPIVFARCRQRAGERAVDVVRRARLDRARSVRIGWNEPRDDRLQHVGLDCCQRLVGIPDVAMGRGRRCLGRRDINGGAVARNRGSSDRGAGTSQKVAARDDAGLGHVQSFAWWSLAPTREPGWQSLRHAKARARPTSSHRWEPGRLVRGCDRPWSRAPRSRR